MLSVFGLVQYSICLVGNAVFLYSAACRHIWRQQSLLQPLLRARAALRPAGRKIEAVQKCGAAKVFEKPVVPLWFPGVFHGYVRSNAVQYLSSVYRCSTFADGDASVGIQTSVAVGECELRDTVDRAICFWIFRRYADLDRSGLGDNGVVPPKIVVYILPHGDDDAGHLQIEEWKEGKRIWKPRQRT